MTWRRAYFEPCAAPGLVTAVHGKIEVLLANLSEQTVEVKKRQVVVFLHLTPWEEYKSVTGIGSLSEFGLAKGTLVVFLVISQELLLGLNKGQKDEVLALFKKYQSIFA